ncbi:MAG: hypothetical protein ACD_10C00166G0002 [uncultured bacterium]|nr:MAG: hypothetical protein ACD_10C00166G0002 [uncultured bacterium]
MASVERYVNHRFDAVFYQIEQDLLDHDAVNDNFGQIFRH